MATQNKKNRKYKRFYYYKIKFESFYWLRQVTPPPSTGDI